MARPSFRSRAVKQLIELSTRYLSLCRACQGCPLEAEVDAIYKKSWDKNRGGPKRIVWACPWYKPKKSVPHKVRPEVERAS